MEGLFDRELNSIIKPKRSKPTQPVSVLKPRKTICSTKYTHHPASAYRLSPNSLASTAYSNTLTLNHLVAPLCSIDRAAFKRTHRPHQYGNWREKQTSRQRWSWHRRAWHVELSHLHISKWIQQPSVRRVPVSSTVRRFFATFVVIMTVFAFAFPLHS